MITDLSIHESKTFSQNYEDGVITAIINELNIKNGFFVEIGVENGKECNCRNLLENNNWSGIMIDNNPIFTSKKMNYYEGSFLNIQQQNITAENVTPYLTDTLKIIPGTIDLFSLDIDGVDYYVLKEFFKSYKPKIIVCEYNSQLGNEKSITIDYDPSFKWDKSYYQGASFMAMANLLIKNGYTPIYCESSGTNMFAIRNDFVKNHFKNDINLIKTLFKQCNFSCGPHPKRIPNECKWVNV